LRSDFPKLVKPVLKFQKRKQQGKPEENQPSVAQCPDGPGEKLQREVAGSPSYAPSPIQSQIHIGTSGWSYDDWKGIFYPPGLKSTEWISYYSSVFSTTEINASFYRLPSRKTVESWIDKVPDNFTFCPKMSRYLTHIKRLNDPLEPVERFFGIFEPMKEKMGPVLIQLPANLKFDYDKTETLYKELRKHHSYSFAMEGRHPTWLEKDSLDLMTKYDIAFVISQSGHGFPYAEYVTSKNIYIRFHGPGKLYASLYGDEDLKKFASLIKRWKQQGHILWIYFNNDYFGNAIKNAKRLEELIREIRI
jgi:uncharacterized protein YecE (DUF72 family)